MSKAEEDIEIFDWEHNKHQALHTVFKAAAIGIAGFTAAVAARMAAAKSYDAAYERWWSQEDDTESDDTEHNDTTEID